MQSKTPLPFSQTPAQMTLDFVGESKPRKDASAQEQETVSLSGLRRAPFYSIAAEHYRLTGRKDRRYATEQDDYP